MDELPPHEAHFWRSTFDEVERERRRAQLEQIREERELRSIDPLRLAHLATAPSVPSSRALSSCAADREALVFDPQLLHKLTKDHVVYLLGCHNGLILPNSAPQVLDEAIKRDELHTALEAWNIPLSCDRAEVLHSVECGVLIQHYKERNVYVRPGAASLSIQHVLSCAIFYSKRFYIRPNRQVSQTSRSRGMVPGLNRRCRPSNNNS